MGSPWNVGSRAPNVTYWSCSQVSEAHAFLHKWLQKAMALGYQSYHGEANEIESLVQMMWIWLIWLKYDLESKAESTSICAACDVSIQIEKGSQQSIGTIFAIINFLKETKHREENLKKGSHSAYNSKVILEFIRFSLSLSPIIDDHFECKVLTKVQSLGSNSTWQEAATSEYEKHKQFCSTRTETQ